MLVLIGVALRFRGQYECLQLRNHHYAPMLSTMSKRTLSGVPDLLKAVTGVDQLIPSPEPGATEPFKIPLPSGYNTINA